MLRDLVTPGITALEYAQRRSRLANKLPKGAVAVLAASEVKYRAPGIFHEYRQETNFFYLTGTAKLWAQITIPTNGVLFCRLQRTKCSGGNRERWIRRQPYIPPLCARKRPQGRTLGWGSVWYTGGGGCFQCGRGG